MGVLILLTVWKHESDLPFRRMKRLTAMKCIFQVRGAIFCSQAEEKIHHIHISISSRVVINL